MPKRFGPYITVLKLKTHWIVVVVSREQIMPGNHFKLKSVEKTIKENGIIPYLI